MYLDKPLRAHTLFQAVCRTNRRWTNPRHRPGEAPRPGRRLHRARQRDRQGRRGARHRDPARPCPPRSRSSSRSSRGESASAMARFDGVDRDRRRPSSSCSQRRSGIATIEARAAFAEEFLRCRGAVRVPVARHAPAADRGRLPLARPHLQVGRSPPATPTSCCGIGSARRPPS